MARSYRVAQAVKQQQISQAASVDLACSLIQVGIADICHSRDILPNDSFMEVKVDGLDDTDTRMLRTGEDACPEAETLNNWISESVREALSSGYISKLIFGLSSDPECRNVLEEYVFLFDHDAEGNIKLQSIGGTHGSKRLAKPDVSSARKQVNKLLRALVSVTRTLDPVPKERTIFCKMVFTDDCPEDYQPPGFVDAGDRAVGFFSTEPFRMRLGEVTTPFHNVQLGVRSVLDSVDVVRGKGPAGDDVSRWETTVGGATQTTGNDDVNGGRGRDNDEALAAVSDDLADLFSEPQEPKKKAAELHGGTEDVADVLTGLRSAAPSHGGNKSCAGGIHSMPGSLCTQSHAARGHPVQVEDEAAVEGDAMEAEQVEQQQVLPESQLSGRGGRKRKTSIVETPIHQTFKRQRKESSQAKEMPPPPTANKREGLRSTRKGRGGYPAKVKK